METANIVDFTRQDGMSDALTEMLRTGAQDLIAQAIEAELSGYMAQFSEMRTEAGHAAVVRNGHHPARPFQTGIGPVKVRIPKVRSKDGYTGDIPFCPCAALCAPNQDVGGCAAMDEVFPERPGECPIFCV